MTYHDHTRDELTGLTVSPQQAEAIHRRLAERDAQVAARAKRSVPPKVIDIDALREIQRKYQPEPAQAPAERVLRKRVHYVKRGGEEEFDLRRGEWVPRDRQYWQNQARYGPEVAEVYEVSDFDGPTTVHHPVYRTIVRRGCGIDGFREIVRTKSPVRIGRLRGYLCLTCHTQWADMSTAERKDLAGWVTRRLREENLIPDDVPRYETVEISPTHHAQNRVLVVNWKSYVWAVRVMRSAHPERQLPGSSPFFYLGPGPLPVEEIES